MEDLVKEILGIIEGSPLFKGIAYSDFEKMYHCIEAKIQKYKKGDIILLSGDTVDFVGLIMSGSISIINEDRNGNITITHKLTVPELFGVVLACAGVSHSPITVQALEESEILFFNYKKILNTCSNACGFHSRLIENMIRIIADKNMMLNQKIEILSKRTTKEKLLCFFDMQRKGAKKFAVPFNREEMAQYLCVDRSAMSNELCKMRDEGMIKFKKNIFEIL